MAVTMGSRPAIIFSRIQVVGGLFRLCNVTIVGYFYYLIFFKLLHVSVVWPSSSRNIFARIYLTDNGSVVFRIQLTLWITIVIGYGLYLVHSSTLKMEAVCVQNVCKLLPHYTAQNPRRFRVQYISWTNFLHRRHEILNYRLNHNKFGRKRSWPMCMYIPSVRFLGHGLPFIYAMKTTNYERSRIVRHKFSCIKERLKLNTGIFGPISGWSQWSRGLRYEMSSIAQTLGSWVWIILNAWKSVCIYSIVLCIGSGLVTGWSPVHGVL
jgi:hypothetical protein